MVVSTRTRGDHRVLTVDGVLDSGTYHELRDTIIDAALDEPTAVIVDVTALRVPAASAWSAFTSARWHVSVWPDVPLLLVCGDTAGRDSIRRIGVTRHVPMHPTVESARTAARGYHSTPRRTQARTRLPAVHSSLDRARAFVTERLTAWSRGDFIPAATIVVEVLVENVLEHTQSAPSLIVESRGETVTVAVSDTSRIPAARHEDPYRGGDTVSGLAVVAAVARSWGSTPTSTGKTVWALIGPETSL
jgi:hypothetical protein